MSSRAGAGPGGVRTAAELVDALHLARDPGHLAPIAARIGPDDTALGMRMRVLFDLAARAAALPLDEVDVLLASPVYEVRMSAWCILDARAKDRRTGEDERLRLFRTYLARHDRITTWDMVDRAAPSVVGGYLVGRGDVGVLHDLAGSAEPLRRRSAITAPLWFVRYGDETDLTATLEVAAVLAADPDPVVHKAVGIALKHAGARVPGAVRSFVAEHGASMPAGVRRQALEKAGAG